MRKDLAQHRNTSHQGEYECKICIKSFAKLGILNQHIAVYHEKKYHKKCDICNQSVQHLKTHMSHCHLKEFQCESCSNSFSNASHLKRHTQRCLRKRFKCETCGKNFLSMKAFSKHVRLHKPYQCELCSKTYFKKSDLVQHRGISHRQDGEYKCKICLKSFAKFECLKIHFKSCLRKKYKCDTCGKNFL